MHPTLVHQAPAGTADGEGRLAPGLLLRSASEGLARVRAAAVAMPFGRRRLVAWVSHDLMDAMTALDELSQRPPGAPGAEAVMARVVTHLADLTELAGCDPRPAGWSRPGDFEAVFVGAASTGSITPA